MTATVLYFILCDAEKCTETLTDNTAWEARHRGRAMGWKCGKQMNSQDLCPKHAGKS